MMYFTLILTSTTLPLRQLYAESAQSLSEFVLHTYLISKQEKSVFVGDCTLIYHRQIFLAVFANSAKSNLPL